MDVGFLLPGEADPVYAGDIDRLFISMVPPDYGPAPLPLAGPVEAWAELTEMRCEGRRSVLAIGDTLVPEHRLRIANGYDNSYDVKPARLLRNVLHLGYRKLIKDRKSTRLNSSP